MSSIFGVADVLREISALLELKDLARFAGTCKSINFSIRELVWSKQESLAPLLAVLPTGLLEPGPVENLSKTLEGTSPEFPLDRVSVLPWDLRLLDEAQIIGNLLTVTGNNGENGEVENEGEGEEQNGAVAINNGPDQLMLMFRRSATADDLRPLAQRCRYVTRIQFNPKDTHAFLIFNLLFRQFPSISFFPALRSVILGWGKEKLDPSHHIFVPFSLLQLPSVKSITVNAIDHHRARVLTHTSHVTPTGLTTLDALTKHCHPNSIKMFTYLPRISRAGEGLAIDAWLANFSAFLTAQADSIQDLVVDEFLGRFFLELLPRLTNLAKLNLGAYVAITRANPNDTDVLSLPQVSHLVTRAADIPKFLVNKKVVFPNASHVHFVDRPWSGPWIIGGLTYEGMLGCAVTNLPNVQFIDVETDFTVTRPARRLNVSVTLDSDYLGRLTQLHGLQRLEFACRNRLRFTLTDDLLLKMARAWPNLTHLYMAPQSNSQSTISLHTLKQLARLCPNLELLGIPVNSSVEHFIGANDIDQWPSALSIASRKPMRLNIDAPSLVDMNEAIVAEFLMTIFPTLKDIHVPDLPPYKPPPSSSPPPLKFDPPVPMQYIPPPPPPKPDEKYLRLERAVKMWRHVVLIVKEMQKSGTRRVAETLRQTARSDTRRNIDIERALILQEEDGDYFMDEEVAIDVDDDEAISG